MNTLAAPPDLDAIDLDVISMARNLLYAQENAANLAGVLSLSMELSRPDIVPLEDVEDEGKWWVSIARIRSGMPEQEEALSRAECEYGFAQIELELAREAALAAGLSEERIAELEALADYRLRVDPVKPEPNIPEQAVVDVEIVTETQSEKTETEPSALWARRWAKAIAPDHQLFQGKLPDEKGVTHDYDVYCLENSNPDSDSTMISGTRFTNYGVIRRAADFLYDSETRTQRADLLIIQRSGSHDNYMQLCYSMQNTRVDGVNRRSEAVFIFDIPLDSYDEFIAEFRVDPVLRMRALAEASEIGKLCFTPASDGRPNVIPNPTDNLFVVVGGASIYSRYANNRGTDRPQLMMERILASAFFSNQTKKSYLPDPNSADLWNYPDQDTNVNHGYGYIYTHVLG